MELAPYNDWLNYGHKANKQTHRNVDDDDDDDGIGDGNIVDDHIRYRHSVDDDDIGDDNNVDDHIGDVNNVDDGGDGIDDDNNVDDGGIVMVVVVCLLFSVVNFTAFFKTYFNRNEISKKLVDTSSCKYIAILPPRRTERGGVRLRINIKT